MRHAESFARRVARATVGVAVLATSAAFGATIAPDVKTVGQKISESPVTPRARAGTPTLDPAGRTIRQTGSSGAQDTLPLDGLPAPSMDKCIPPSDPDAISRDSSTAGRSVDPCGRIAGDAGSAPPRAALASTVTIDRMTTTGGYTRTHTIGGTLVLFGSASTYFLGNATSWQSGAGSYQLKGSYLDHVEVDGTKVRYVLRAPSDGLMYQQTDYDSGDHSAQGSLGTSDALVLEATIGSTTATISGSASIVSNDATYYGDRFNYYSSIPGSTVPYELTYTIVGTTWQPGTFEASFNYSCTGWVDFAHPTTTPAMAALAVRGSAQVPANAVVAYAGVVQYVNGVERDVSSRAGWQVDPSSIAQITGGVLSTGTFAYDRQELTIRASFTAGGATVEGAKTVVGRLGSAGLDAETWPAYQANERHTGYVPREYDPETFSLRWTKTLGPGYALNPVTSAEGRLFASLIWYFGSGPSLFALDARDGEILWTQNLGNPFSVNPPAWGYGNVYIQTCNNSGDTWLHAFDAATGERIFKAPLEAQWERYYAPTVFDGDVYVDGGGYGGMYALNAFSGTRRWFQSLPQYDQWTPGIAGDYAYAYVGDYSPGLYVLDRHSGQERAFIADDGFVWNGWSMNLAPVILDDGDAVAIHDGRLIRFDLQGRSIGWQVASSFSGQPSYARGVIYAVNGDRVVAVSPDSGAELWSWTPPSAPLTPLVVTDSHLFVSTSSSVYAVDVSSREPVWSYPTAGSLALGDENLYVARQDGTLVAIAAVPISPAPPVSIEIRGPDDVSELTSAQYRSFVHYADGRVREKTHATRWHVSPTTYSAIDANGVMSVAEMLDLSQQVAVVAEYTELGVTVSADKSVDLHVSVTLRQFIERNRSEASAIQLDVIARLAEALARERAILRALGLPATHVLGGHPDPFVAAVVRAILAGDGASYLTQAAIDQLSAAGPSPETAP